MDHYTEPGESRSEQQAQITLSRAMADRKDTIAAIATPAGNGGIGIVRLSGPACLQIAHSLTRISPQPRHAHFCTFRDHDEHIIDKGILLYFKGPESFTGEDVVEFHGHGGQVVMGLLLQETLFQGARLARPGEFTERAYLNDRIDLVQAEAIADLINSSSSRAARSAARSLDGVFSEYINRSIETLISLRVFVEGALDFPEEEIDFLAKTDLMMRMQGLYEALTVLLKRAVAGNKLKSGVRVAIIGSPNVGKSSLLNRLLGSNRAIVTDIAGTTRDTIDEAVLLDGVQINIVDTAGLRKATDPVEQEGIRRTHVEIDKADAILLVLDVDPDKSVAELKQELGLKPDQKLLLVRNKIDINELLPYQRITTEAMYLGVSAYSGAGIDLLEGALRDLAGNSEVEEDLLLARKRHVDAIRVARDAIHTGMEGYLSSGSTELLAEELRNAQTQLGEITGAFHNEDLLGEIFSTFCIGK